MDASQSSRRDDGTRQHQGLALAMQQYFPDEYTMARRQFQQPGFIGKRPGPTLAEQADTKTGPYRLFEAGGQGTRFSQPRPDGMRG